MAFQIHERAEQFVDSAIRVRAVRGLEAASGESEGLGWPDHPAPLQRDVRRHPEPLPERAAVHVAAVRGLLVRRVVEGRLEHGQQVAVVLAVPGEKGADLVEHNGLRLVVPYPCSSNRSSPYCLGRSSRWSSARGPSRESASSSATRALSAGSSTGASAAIACTPADGASRRGHATNSS